MSRRVDQAQASVKQAREALIDTARELQQRLQPKTLARDAWESAKVKGAHMAEDAVDAVKRRPVATGGIIAAIAMFLAREPIKEGFSRMVDAMTSDEEEPLPASPVRKLASTSKKTRRISRARRRPSDER